MTGDNRLFAFLSSAGIRVFGEVPCNGCNTGLLDVVRRWEIGLACAKVHHVVTLTAQFVGIGGHLHGG